MPDAAIRAQATSKLKNKIQLSCFKPKIAKLKYFRTGDNYGNINQPDYNISKHSLRATYLAALEYHPGKTS